MLPKRHTNAEADDILRRGVEIAVRFIIDAYASAADGIPNLQAQGSVFRQPYVGPTPEVAAISVRETDAGDVEERVATGHKRFKLAVFCTGVQSGNTGWLS
jgi:hypothetical protein